MTTMTVISLVGITAPRKVAVTVPTKRKRRKKRKKKNLAAERPANPNQRKVKASQRKVAVAYLSKSNGAPIEGAPFQERIWEERKKKQ
jgi:hypothetical protein